MHLDTSKSNSSSEELAPELAKFPSRDFAEFSLSVDGFLRLGELTSLLALSSVMMHIITNYTMQTYMIDLVSVLLGVNIGRGYGNGKQLELNTYMLVWKYGPRKSSSGKRLKNLLKKVNVNYGCKPAELECLEELSESTTALPCLPSI